MSDDQAANEAALKQQGEHLLRNRVENRELRIENAALDARVRELENARTEYVTKAQCAARCLEMAMTERAAIVAWLRNPRQNYHEDQARHFADALESSNHHASSPGDTHE